MDKIKKPLFLALVVLVLVTFSGCSKENNLSIVAKDLTEYDINMIVDCDAKAVDVEQRVNYINQSNDDLSDVRFHIYVRAFEQGAKNVAVSRSQMAKAYPNGESYANFTLNSLKF